MNPDTAVEERLAVLDAPTLNALDRCDACGSQAYVRVTLTLSELLFCGHHWTKYGDALSLTALSVHNEMHKLSA